MWFFYIFLFWHWFFFTFLSRITQNNLLKEKISKIPMINNISIEFSFDALFVLRSYFFMNTGKQKEIQSKQLSCRSGFWRRFKSNLFAVQDKYIFSWIASQCNALRSDPSDWTKDRHKLSNSTIIELDRSNLYQFRTVKRLKPFSINHFYFYLFHAKETVSFYLLSIFKSHRVFFDWLSFQNNHFALFESALINNKSKTYVICFRCC